MSRERNLSMHEENIHWWAHAISITLHIVQYISEIYFVNILTIKNSLRNNYHKAKKALLQAQNNEHIQILVHLEYNYVVKVKTSISKSERN